MLAGAMAGSLAVIGALLVTNDDTGQLGFETAAETPEIAAAAGADDAPGSAAEAVADQDSDARARGLSYAFDPGVLVEPAADNDADTPSGAGEDDDETEPAADDEESDGDEDSSSSSSTSLTTTSSSDSSDSTSTTAGSSATTTTEEPASTTTTTAQSTTTTTAASTTITTAACSGARWSSVLSEDFNGSSVDSGRWAVYNSGGNAGYGVRRPSAMSVSGGNLNITASIVDGTLVSGGMEHRHNQTYGRYEFRVRTDVDLSEATSGIVLTWPQSNVHPRDGENNIYETLATPGDRHEFYTFIHEPYGTVHDQDYTVHPVSSASWRTMVMEWTPNWIKLYRDGSLVKTIDETGADLIPDVPHHVSIQLDAWKHSVSGPVTMQVDYIRVQSYEGGC